MTLLLAVDQGTSSSKAVLVDAAGTVVARGAAPLGAEFPRPGWVQQDPDAIWRSVLDAIRTCLDAAGGVAPAALALTNQRESAIVWRRADGAPLGPVIGWQDGRTGPACERLREAGHAAWVEDRTGLALDPMFSATKLRWLLERAPGGLAAAERGDVCAGTIDAWLVHRLTGGEVFATDGGNASRTLLMDLRAVAWDGELCELFGVPPAALPEIRRSDGGFGVARALPGAPPIAAVLADSHAALFGHGCFRPGSGKATFGTGSSVMRPVDTPAGAGGGVATTLAWLTDQPTYALEGNVIATGAALDWMGRVVGAAGGAGLEALAAEVDSSAEVHFVPAFGGLGAPYWDRGASGIIDGLTGGTTRAHLARAALEAVAFQVADVVAAMDAASDRRLDVLHADGGAAASPTVMQLVADLAGRAVLASRDAEVSALGAAHLAGVAAGVWAGEGALSALPRPATAYRPALGEADRAARLQGWHAAVARSRARTTSLDTVPTEA